MIISVILATNVIQIYYRWFLFWNIWCYIDITDVATTTYATSSYHH